MFQMMISYVHSILIYYPGMFLFAKLVMENLYEQTSRDNLLDELQNFPTGLDEAYVVLKPINYKLHIYRRL